VLRKIFGPKRDGVTGEWRKLHNEELHDLYLYLLEIGWAVWTGLVQLRIGTGRELL
jgi:hypothetical protein